MEAQTKTHVNYFAIPGLVGDVTKSELIFQIVCNHYGFSVEHASRKTRKREVVEARQVSMYFAKHMTRDSLATIGMKIGGKDHATVLYACKTINNLIDSDKKFAEEIRSLYEKVYKRVNY
jgi:chromosomal replication initiator protein